MGNYYDCDDCGDDRLEPTSTDKPKTTLSEILAQEVEGFLATVKGMPEVDLPHLIWLHVYALGAALDDLRADELPDYDAPATDDMSDDERKALEEATGNG